MTIYECLNLVVGAMTFAVGALTLLVLFRTLCVLREYAHDTRKLAIVAVEQLPRPCVVLQQSADTSVEAVSYGTACSLLTNKPDEPSYNPLKFMNVGTGPAVKCLYHVVKATPDTYQLPEIAPGRYFLSDHPLNGLPPENDVNIIIEYESVAGSKYRTELIIQDGRFVKKTTFPPSSLF